MFCIHCGASNANEASFCSKCGKSQADVAANPAPEESISPKAAARADTPAQSRSPSKKRAGLLILAGVVFGTGIVFTTMTNLQSRREAAAREAVGAPSAEDYKALRAAASDSPGATPRQTKDSAPAPNAAPQDSAPAPASPPPPAVAVPQNTIVGRWKFSQFGGVGDQYLIFTEDGHYKIDNILHHETGLYVFNSTDGSLRIQDDGFFSHDTQIWHCHLSADSMAVLEGDTGGTHTYARVSN